MVPEQIFRKIGSLPYMRVDQAKLFYDLILGNRLANCLELGCFHGVSTAYIAGAVQDLGTGGVITIDLTTATAREPNFEWVLSTAGIRHLVTVYLEPRSFNWRLMKFLEEGLFEHFDFCYIDGGHTWYDTGLAFCLVERLLKPGGWVAFDDLQFTYRTSSLRNRPAVLRMPEEEQTIPQVQRVFDLLVETDPHFGCFRRIGQFGFARKEASGWSKEQRVQKQEDILIAKALDKARHDPEYRVMLLRSPGRALCRLSGKPESDFAHLMFEETERLAPLAPSTSDYGSKILYMEPPAWEHTASEADLEDMLRK